MTTITNVTINSVFTFDEKIKALRNANIAFFHMNKNTFVFDISYGYQEIGKNVYFDLINMILVGKYENNYNQTFTYTERYEAMDPIRKHTINVYVHENFINLMKQLLS